METIYKYVLENESEFSLSLPKNAEILTVQTKDGIPHIWAKVDTEAPKEQRLFKIVNTGEGMTTDNLFSYIGTFQMHNGRYVGHLFEVKSI